jgi:hypothetical protein
MIAFQEPPSRRGINSNNSRASARLPQAARDSIARFKRKVGTGEREVDVEGKYVEAAKWAAIRRAAERERWDLAKWRRDAYREEGIGEEYQAGVRVSRAAKRRPAAMWAEVADTTAAELEVAAAAMAAARGKDNEKEQCFRFSFFFLQLYCTVPLYSLLPPPH